MRNTVAILGIPVDDLNTAEVLDRIEEFVVSQRFHQVATANTDFLVRAHADPELMAVLRNADLVVPDGMPVVRMSRLLGAPLRERVTGADLVPALAERAAMRGYKLFMLGGREEVARAAKAELERCYPGLRVVGCVSPPISHILDMDNEGLLAEIEAAQPDILLVAFGNPKQEKWIHMHRHRLRVPVCIGVGGTFDFIAGAVARAPQWVQAAGMEWMFRILQEPRRLWRRYANDLVYFARFASAQLWVMRRSERRDKASVMAVKLQGHTVISVSGSLEPQDGPTLQRELDGALNAGTDVVMDLSAATHVDSVTLGTLLNLPKRAAHVGRTVRLVNPAGQAARALKVAGVADGLVVNKTLVEALTLDDPWALQIEIDEGAPQTLVRIRGAADVYHAGKLAERLGVVQPPQAGLVVDMRDVYFIDCAGIAVLRELAHRCRAADCEVRWVVNERVRTHLAREHQHWFHPSSGIGMPAAEPPVAAGRPLA